MTDLSLAQTHTVFPVEVHGDTLIVRPVGEKREFGEAVLQSELKRVERMLDDPAVAHLLVDLGSEAYLGSEMIGTINSLLSRVSERGGRAAVCNMSVDMHTGIKAMGLDQTWTIFDSRSEAVAEIVTPGPMEKAAPWLLTVAVLVMLGATAAIVLAVWNPFVHRDVDREAWQTMAQTWRTRKAMFYQSPEPNNVEWRYFANTSKKKIEDLLEDLPDAEQPPARRNLRSAAENLIEVLNEPRERATRPESAFRREMSKAAESLEIAEELDGR